MLLKRLAAVLAALMLGACTQVQEKTLDNGLRIVVREDHRAPVVVSQLWYRVGSMDEPKGSTGISHVLEHMMFKGTSKHGPNEFSRIIAENGGRENAFTGRDYTVYFQQLEKSRLPIALELEADRMQNLLLAPEEFAKEVKVVMEERRLRTDDQPDALLYEKFQNTAFQAHNYGNPVIGWMADLERMKAEDLRAWYQRWYTPANATLVVVGDVRPREVFELAQRYFGPLPARPVERAKLMPEPVQSGPRRVRLKAPAEVATIQMGYHVPVLTGGPDDWQVYALQVLTGVLDGGASSRFSRELVRGRQVVAGLDTDYSPIARAPVLLTFSGTPARGRSIPVVEAAVRGELERLKKDLVDESELKRVKAQVLAADVYGRDSVFYQAMRIGTLANAGLDWRQVDTYVERIQAVTAEQLRQVARKYLTDDNLTVAVLDPLPMKGSKRPAAVRGGSDYVR